MRLIPTTLIVLLLAACQAERPGCAGLPGGGAYCLQSAAAPAFSTLQQSVLTVRGERVTMLARIESDPRGLRFAGMTPLGQTLMSVSWENGALRADLPPALAARFDPALLPALVQIAMWPAASVRAGLSPELELIEEEPNRRKLRRKSAGGEEDVLDISWEGTLPYQRLRIVAPMGVRIDVKAIDEPVEEAK